MNPAQRVKLALFLGITLMGFWAWISGSFESRQEPVNFLEWPDYTKLHLEETLPTNAEGFVYPICPPLGEGAYLFRAFGEENSTAEIWKLEPGGSKKRADVVAMGDGLILMAEKWGGDFKGVVVILHRVSDPELPLIESLVAGLDTLKVKPGQQIKRGEKIGAIEDGELNGLLWEVRDGLGLGMTPVTLEDRTGWIKPSGFMQKHPAR